MIDALGGGDAAIRSDDGSGGSVPPPSDNDDDPPVPPSNDGPGDAVIAEDIGTSLAGRAGIGAGGGGSSRTGG